jgi:cyclic pyranopterin phosphate synthase
MSTSPLIDQFGRQIEYVRLSVTDKCNMRCFYCMPEGFKGFEEPNNWLNFTEIQQVIAAFVTLGVKRVRLTGGEPLVRRNVSDLASNLSKLTGLEDLSMSTNATLLTKYASALTTSGISRINVSLDSLDQQRFAKITGKDQLPQVLQGLEAAKQAGLTPIKINMVAMKGINDDEYSQMVQYCTEMGFTLRFIETMPIGTTGRDASRYYHDLSIIKQRLIKEFDLVPSVMSGGGPARYYKIQGSDINIGFITPISQHFCETCNRVRLSVDGTLYLCLGDEYKVELRPLLREGISNTELQNVLIQSLNLKPLEHDFKTQPEKVMRFMSMTGG